MTDSQKRALEWLQQRGGDGVFNKFGVALAHGQTAPFDRKTWNALRDLGKIEFYGGAKDGGKGYGRLRMVKA